jgi:flagellar biosynthesis anti-sigma factor FlgM
MNVRNDLSSLQPIAGDNQVSPAAKSSAAKTSIASVSDSATPVSDQAHLSSAASLASQAASLPDVRMEKVQSTQAAIAGGTYNIPSADVAQSLVNHMLGGQS